MSSTTLWGVYKTTCRTQAQFRNSWGSAPPLWDMLGYRYLGLDISAAMAGDAVMSRVCRLACNLTIPEHLRITLACTFDFAIIPPGQAGAAADAFRLTHRDILAEPPRQSRYSDTPSGPMTWSHWPALADALLAAKVDSRLLGWGIGCTSVSDPWEAYRRKPEWREPFDAVDYARSPPAQKAEDAP